MMRGSKTQLDGVYLDRQDKVIVGNEKQLKRFMKSYQNIDKIKQIDDSDISYKHHDPIIQYLKIA